MDDVRRLERQSIRAFVASCRFAGTVLDYGCGQQPYAEIVLQQGAGYIGYDHPALPGSTVQEPIGAAGDPLAGRPIGPLYDTILCTQVIQYVPDVPALLSRFRAVLPAGTQLVMTGPTCWPEVEDADLHRFTRSGIRRLLEDAGFRVDRLEERAAVEYAGVRFPLGWGAVAVADW